ncbi:hypothetical protein Clacol_007019 [Clathrus columnatus]|uniref:Uncharacterized protein n=1 Tax=Clathrus columnatus TaxID=1419009 RepID=A0AAV5AJD2_9AGAM|nr:hypothetical protein Clacol_007019 [Clathrus columnatus]
MSQEMTSDEKEYPPPPPHWKAPEAYHPVFGPLPLMLYRALCLVSVCKLTLDHHWHAKCDEEIFQREKDQLIGQINNGNIVCGLILATTAAFITTSPPVSSIMNYTTLPAYVFLLLSFAQAIGSIVTGTAVIAVYQSVKRPWCRDV